MTPPATPPSDLGAPANPVLDPRRLAAVRATGLLDTQAEEPFDRLARLATVLLGTPMAFITMVDDTRSFWKSCIGVDATEPADRQNTVEESFCQYVVSSGESLIAGDTANHPVTKDNVSIEGMGVAAWAGFPVHSPDGEVLGTFCVVDTEPREFRTDQVEALASLAEAATAEVGLRMALTSLEEVTDTLRETLLPPRLPAVPGLDLAASHLPAVDGHGVLGDFYDAFEEGGRWWFPLGDVCGHGPPAAKATSLARWSIRANVAGAAGPEHVVRRLNDQLLTRPEREAPHLTLALATVDPRQRSEDGMVSVQLAVAGHPPARILRSDGTVEVADAMGMALGWFDDATVGTTTVELRPGDALVLFTDGVLEAGPRDRLFGEEGLDATLATVGGRDARAIVDAVVAATTTHAPRHRDDVAVLVLRNPT